MQNADTYLDRIFSNDHSGLVVEGWLGRGTTALHCTYHVPTHRLKDLSLFLFVFFFQSISVSFCRIMMYVDDSCGEFHTQRREKPSRVLCPQHTGHHFRDLLAGESGEGLAQRRDVSRLRCAS